MRKATAALPMFSSYAEGAMGRRSLPAIRACRNVEGCEAARPLRELNPMGGEIRDAVVFLVVAS